MAQRTQVELELIALVKQAQQDFKKFADDTQKRLDGLNFKTGVTAIKAGFDLIGAAARPVFNLLEQGFQKAVDEALEAEKATTQLSNAMRILNDFSKENIADFEEFAKQLQRTTAFSDEQALSALALAKQYRATNKEAKQVVEVAADLAARTGEDLLSATRAVGQSLNGFVSRDLAKTIPALKQLSKESLIAGEGISVIAKEVQGSAKALTGTFGGALQQLKNNFDDVFEEFGKAIISTPELTEAVRSLGAQFGVLAVGIAKLAPSIVDITANFIKFTTAAIVPFVQSAKNVVTGVALIQSAFDQARQNIAAFGKLVSAVFETIIIDSKAFPKIQKAIDGFNLKPAGFLEDFKQRRGDIKAAFDPFINGLKTVRDNVKGIAGEANKALSEASKGPSSSGAGNRALFAITDEDRERMKRDAEKALAEQRKVIESASKEPIKQIVDVVFGAQIDTRAGIAVGAGIINNILKGAEGAKKAVSETFGAIANALIPGIGPVVSEIVDVLGQGPEKVQEMIDQFTKALPTIISNVAKSIPTLIRGIADAVPEIVSALVAAIPEIVVALVREMPSVAVALATQMPRVAIELIQGIIRNVDDIALALIDALIDGLADGIKEIFDLINPFDGGDGGGLLGGIPILGDIADLLPFAEGGAVPDNPKFEGDRFPARLDAGEEVLDRSTSKLLRRALEGGGFGGPSTVVIQVGEQELANVILNLNRRGYRTA